MTITQQRLQLSTWSRGQRKEETTWGWQAPSPGELTKAKKLLSENKTINNDKQANKLHSWLLSPNNEVKLTIGSFSEETKLRMYEFTSIHCQGTNRHQADAAQHWGDRWCSSVVGHMLIARQWLLFDSGNLEILAANVKEDFNRLNLDQV